jgi:signal transduction histidine kinase
MPRTRLSWIVRLIFILIPLLILGLSILLFVIEARHHHVLETQTRQVRTVQQIDQAMILLERQRVRVAQSVYAPLDRATFREQAAEFRALLTDPEIFAQVERREPQEQVLAAYDVFVQRALALPPSPSPAQVREVQQQAELAAARLQTLEALHAANIEEIIRTNIEQSRIGTFVLFVTNLTILALILVGFRVLTRLGQQQAEVAALRATDQLRNEFVAFTAHELRNPASAIKTGASLLRDPDLEPDIQRAVAESISRSADALSRLVLTLLTMGRLEEGRLLLNRRTILTTQLMDDLVAELEVYHHGIAQRIVRDLPEVPVDIDPEYTKLAFANIIDNAMKYAPPNTAITVTGEREDAMVLIHVHNRGPAIPPEVLPHIFEKYETTGAAPYSSRRGVGLGLYMTRLLVEAHGGWVRASSAPGEGVTITVALPVAE